MKRTLASVALGLACFVVLSVPVAADDGPTNSDPLNPPGKTTQTLQEGVVDVLLGSWSALWSLIV